MTEDEYRRFIAEQRIRAQQHLYFLTSEWRRQLWPDPSTDPIAREQRRKRLMRELMVNAYWGLPPRPIYGGICGA